MGADLNPHLGHPGAKKGHVPRFLAWAHDHGQTTTAQHLLRLIGDLHNEDALGSTLAFLTQPATWRTLGQWLDHPAAASLRDLSEALDGAPRIAAPLAPGNKPSAVFRNSLTEHYLAAQIAATPQAQLPGPDKQRLHQLRVWVLVVAYDALLLGYPLEKHLNTVCTQMRIGLDASEVDDGNTQQTEKNLSKVRWLCDVSPPQGSFAQFSTALHVNLKRNRPVGDQGLLATMNGFFGLIKREYALFIPPNAANAAASPLDYSIQINYPNSIRPPGDLYLAADSFEVRQLSVSTAESGAPLFEVRTDSPEEFAKLRATSRRIAYQTEEDRQYLHFSWTRLSPWERKGLNELIKHGLNSTDPEFRLLAAISSVAIVAQLSMRSMKYVSLRSSEVASAALEKSVWVLDLKAGTFTRPSGRHLKAAPRTTDHVNWTQEITEDWQLVLSHELLEPLAAAWLRAPSAKTLDELFPGSLEQRFNDWTKTNANLWRVTSGFLAVAGEQMAFDQTGDPTFARLLLNWPASATTGSMAYPGWTRAQVAGGFSLISAGRMDALETVADHVNAMGSRLSLLDEKVALELQRAQVRLSEIAVEDDWVAFHNALTTYCVTALLVMTGARPARSIFERLSQIDFVNRRIFIDDKASLETVGDKDGRLIPLPDIAIRLICDLYLPYLKHLLHELKQHGYRLEAGVASVIDAQDPLLPLFFRISHADPNEWLEVTESSLVNRQLFDWSLPANVFRHRMATALRTAGLDAELIDAHLGHAEAGSETFGDLSARCWINEEEDWRKRLEQALRPLHLSVPRLKFPTISDPSSPQPHDNTAPRPFGAVARKLARTLLAENARTEALEAFKQFEREKPPAARSPEEWETLRNEILFDRKDNVRSAAAHRYQVLQAQLDRLTREQGVSISVKTWVTPQNPGTAAFGAAALHSEAKLARARAALDGLYLKIGKAETNRFKCALACITDIAVNTGLSDAESLQCIAGAKHERMALVVIQGFPYLEICPEGRTLAEGPVRRYLVPSRSLPLLNRLVEPIGAKLTELETNHQWAQGLTNSMGLPTKAGLPAVVDWLCYWVDHNNTLTRPGLQASVLAGRVASYSLSRTDFLSAVLGERLSAPTALVTSETAQNTHDSETVEPGWLKRHDAAAKGGRQAAATLLQKLNRSLHMFYDKRTRDGKQPHAAQLALLAGAKKDEAYTRANALEDMRAAIREAVAVAPKTVLLLAEWTVHLLERGQSKKELSGSSVERYLGALSSGFLQHADEIDITDADQEEVTDFYQNVIDPTLVRPELLAKRAPKKDQQYVLDRLIAFHRFAKRFGAVSPYWDEISEGLSNSAVSPGFISPKEYSHALRMLCPDPKDATPTQLLFAFFLLLTYRFGLRGAEAVHLSRKNWIDLGGAIVLIVDHKHRKLKTAGSRRKVPLIVNLDDFEMEIVENWFWFRYGSTDYDGGHRLLVNPKGGSDLSDLTDLRAHVVAALRWATCNNAIKLHHTRHSLANLVGLSLLPETAGREALWHNAMDNYLQVPSHARKLLLETEKSTRRSLWAVSRTLGHTRRETTCVSYLHFLHDWCARTSQLAAPGKPFDRPRTKLKNVTYLDDAPRDPLHLVFPDTPLPPAHVPISAGLVMEYLRSRSRGLSPARAGTGTFGRLSADAIDRLESALGDACVRVAPQGTAPQDACEMFAERIRKGRWNTLIHLARQCDHKNFGLPREALQQISTGLQLILYTKEHFANFYSTVAALSLKQTDVQIRTPRHPNVNMLARLNAFSPLDDFIEPKVAGVMRYRIDKFVSTREDDTDTYGNRFAVIVPSEVESTFTDALGLVALWICLSLSDYSG